MADVGACITVGRAGERLRSAMPSRLRLTASPLQGRACAAVACAALLVSCGGRTGLDLSFATQVPDAATDAEPDEDAEPVDGAPPVAPADAPPPSADASVDAGPLEVSYLFDGAGVLYRYNPVTGRHVTLGTPDCADSNGLWTATVGREAAYIEFQDGAIYAVDLGTLACTPTLFDVGALDVGYEFGIAVSSYGGVEHLYVYGVPGSGSAPILAVSDLVSFTLTEVGPITPPPPSGAFTVNLTADGSGHLYAFSPDGVLQEIEETSATLERSIETGITTDGTWASAVHGADVFLIIDTEAIGYDPASGARVSRRDIGIAPIGGGTVFIAQ